MQQETFADYILSEKDWVKKMEIMYYMQKKTGIFYDNSVVFKAFITRLFLNYGNNGKPLDGLDENLIITATLLCNCMKNMNPQEYLTKVKTYAKDGAQYLQKLGFNERFCGICEGVNRYSEIEPREPESDILELVDQFGGMLLDRPERIGFKPDEALVLLQHRNMKGKDNRYLDTFVNFVNEMQEVLV